MSTSVFTTAPCDICAKGLRIGNRFFVIRQPRDASVDKPYDTLGMQDCCSIQCVADWATLEGQSLRNGAATIHVHDACDQCGKLGWIGFDYSVLIHGPVGDVQSKHLCSVSCVVEWTNIHDEDDILYEDEDEFYDEEEDDWYDDEYEDEDEDDD